MCFSTNKRRRDVSSGPNKLPRIFGDYNRDSAAESSRRPLSNRRLNSLQPPPSLPNTFTETGNGAGASENSAILVPSSPSPVKSPQQQPCTLDESIVTTNNIANEAFIYPLSGCYKPDPEEDILDEGKFVENDGENVMPGGYDSQEALPPSTNNSPRFHPIGSYESQALFSAETHDSGDLGSFGDIQDLLKDPDVIRAMEGPCISAVHSPFSQQGVINIPPVSPRIDLLNLSPLHTPPPTQGFSGELPGLPFKGANEDWFSGTLTTRTINYRKRPRGDLNADFWRQCNMICNEYREPTKDIPFPILSNYYATPVRICDFLAIRNSASSAAVQYTDHCWEDVNRRNGPLNLLQKEQQRVFDHSTYTYSHIPSAVARGDMITVLKAVSIMRTQCDYMESLCKEDAKVRREAKTRRRNGSILY